MSEERIKTDATSEIVNEAEVNGSVPSNKPETGSGRRQFLKRTVGAGITAGLGHFLLIGRNPKKAAADQDYCQPPYTPQAGDECLGTENTDICFPDSSTTGDDCQLSSDRDKCDASTDMGDECKIAPAENAGDQCHILEDPRREVGDECPTDNSPMDECNVYPYTPAAGDKCDYYPSKAGDTCDWGDTE